VAYKIVLKDRAQREVQIAAGVAASTKTEEFFDYKDSRTELPVIHVPIDLPVYRMENFRTFSEQAEYLVREKKDKAFFRVGQENESAQQVQHEILAKLAEKGKADSVMPVATALRHEGQRERILITSSGVVVNGNRRLAGMRELYESDKATFHHFSHVWCMVLPADATPADILQIEGVLQGRPETKLDYDWIGDAELVKAIYELHKGDVDQAARTLSRKPSEVKTTLQALAEAEVYLRDWAKAEGEYSRVAESGEQLFKDLPGLLANKPQDLQEASRAIAWTLFENGGKLEGRLYSYNVAIGKRAQDVLVRLSEDLGIPIGSGDNLDDELDFDLKDEAEVGGFVPLVAALKEGERKAEAVEALIEICTSVLESEKDKKSENAALKAVTAAHSKLVEVDLSRAGASTYDAIERQLSGVIRRAAELQEALEQVRHAHNDAAAVGST
jgi:hypothetical protein